MSRTVVAALARGAQHSFAAMAQGEPKKMMPWGQKQTIGGGMPKQNRGTSDTQVAQQTALKLTM